MGKLIPVEMPSLIAKTEGTKLYGDGDGLWLRVSQSRKEGAKPNASWLLRYMVDGQAHSMGLGSLKKLSLADARKMAAKLRETLGPGGDPIEQRKLERAAAKAERARRMTFRVCGDRYIERNEAAWTNAKHRYQWRQTLDMANAVFGDVPVSEITTGMVLKLLEPIWATKTDTASRLRGRIEAVLDWATLHGHRSGENPARWRGHLEKALDAPSKVRDKENYPSLPYARLPAYWTALAGEGGVAALALRFLVLTALRHGEVTLGTREAASDVAKRSPVRAQRADFVQRVQRERRRRGFGEGIVKLALVGIVSVEFTWQNNDKAAMPNVTGAFSLNLD